MTIEVTFYKDKSFKILSFFDGKNEPIVLEGEYEVHIGNIIANPWNKGNPIKVSVKNDCLLMEMQGESPLLLKRIGK